MHLNHSLRNVHSGLIFKEYGVDWLEKKNKKHPLFIHLFRMNSLKKEKQNKYTFFAI